jgi:hypothetical protein
MILCRLSKLNVMLSGKSRIATAVLLTLGFLGLLSAGFVQLLPGQPRGQEAPSPAAATKGKEPVFLAFPEHLAGQRQADYLSYDRYRQALLHEGIDASLYQLPLEVARLNHFNVLVYGGWDEDSAINRVDAETRKRAAAERAVLEAYVKDGGGLVLLPAVRRYPGQAIDEYYNLVFEGFGVKVLREGLWDSDHQFVAEETLAFPAMPYFMTAQVRPHPVTAAVTRLALPQRQYQNGPPGVAALCYDANWTVVVSGEETARSYQTGADARLDLKRPGTCSSSPPIAAVRTFGKGRVFCYPLHLAYISLNFDNPSWPQTVETRGDVAARRPSDSHRLVVNAVKWVGEPSRQLAGFGKPERTAARPIRWPESAPFHRLDLGVYRPRAPDRGILGVHTALSDGRGTVADYARAGLKAGLRFLVFAEAVEHLTPEKWQTLVRECRNVSQNGEIYLVPGYEYTDANGARWAIWGEQVVYPRPHMWTKDGKRILRDGDLVQASNFAARMLLTYDKLPGDPGNLWWYYQVPLWVYDEDRLQADNTRQYLLAWDNLYAVSAACFTRIRSPEAVAAAARRCTLNVDRTRHASARAAVNTSLAKWDSWTYASQGGDEGPTLAWIESFRPGGNLYRTRGVQRWRGAFVARSDVGLREVRLHDGTSGPVRRYLCRGARDFRRVVELALDRQHPLVLEAIDVEGRRAVHSAVRLYDYEQGLYRCGDNLNILGSTPTVAHPDRHEFPRFPVLEDVDLLGLRGFDTGVGLLNQPWAEPTTQAVQTQAGRQGAHSEGDVSLLVQVPTRFPFASYEVSVAQARSDRHVKRLQNEVALGPFLPRDRELEFARIDRRVYLLRSRMDYFIKWAFQRPHEAVGAYQGDLFLHEGTVTFTQDGTLSGDVPVELETVHYKGGSAYGQAEWAAVDDTDLGPQKHRFGPADRPEFAGTLRKGGFIAGQSTDGGTLALVPALDEMRYRVATFSTGPKSLHWVYSVGVGRAGQTFQKGETLRFRYVAASISGRTPRSEELLRSLGAALGLGAQPDAEPFRVKVGRLQDAAVLFHGRAQGGEFIVRFGTWPLLINRPLRIEGVQDNGCAAVYVLDGDPWERRFRFVGVFEGAALFQQNTDRPATVWVGNPFSTADARLKLTLVPDGLGPGEAPFLEVHNPTDRPVTTVLRSPPHTPVYGGFTRRITVPAGDSIIVRLPLGKGKQPRLPGEKGGHS